MEVLFLRISIFLCTLINHVIRGQEIFAYDNCDLITCPLDCHLTIPNGEECPICSCPLGQRCPRLNCPPEPTCLKVQRLDGCLNCACGTHISIELTNGQYRLFTAGATYHAFDENQNLATYVTNPKDILSPAKETCNLYDMQSVQRCMKELLTYMKTVERTNPDVIAHPMVSMFLYSRSELLELCNLYSQSLRCVSTDTRERCSDQERHMNMMISVFDSVCSSRSNPSDRFLSDYECIHNILVAHVNADQCSNEMSRRFGKTRKDNSQMQIKRQRKCDALNEFLDCVQPTLNLFCGSNAAESFRFGLLNATNAIAPECKTQGNSFVPLLIQDRGPDQSIDWLRNRLLVIR